MKEHVLILFLTCPDRPGIVHEVSGFVLSNGGNIVQNNQFGDPGNKFFGMRVEFMVEDADIEQLRAGFLSTADRFEMSWRLVDKSRPSRVLIMVSRFDHCLIDLVYRQQTGELNIEIPAVVSNHRDLEPLVSRYGLPFHHVPVDKDDKPKAEKRLLELVELEQIDFIVLARYMQILTPEFCQTLAGRIINIHHSFLPGFKGARPYDQAHERGVKLIGATAHFATADLDEGPIIEQDVQRVTHAQDPAQLAAVGRDIETRVLSPAVQYMSEHRIALNGVRTVVFA